MFSLGASILVDCNVFIEASRVGAISTLLGHYKIVTTNTCVEEAASGNVYRRDYIGVDTEGLKSKVVVVTVSDIEKTRLSLALQGRVDLDPGEEDLLAHALTLTDSSFSVCSPDIACVRAGFLLDFIDRYVSLEELLDRAGNSRSLRSNYTKKWMERIRTKLTLDSL